MCGLFPRMKGASMRMGIPKTQSMPPPPLVAGLLTDCVNGGVLLRPADGFQRRAGVRARSGRRCPAAQLAAGGAAVPHGRAGRRVRGALLWCLSFERLMKMPRVCYMSWVIVRCCQISSPTAHENCPYSFRSPKFKSLNACRCGTSAKWRRLGGQTKARAALQMARAATTCRCRCCFWI